MLILAYPLTVGRSNGRKYSTRADKQNRHSWWKAVTNKGNLKSSPLPNIHLLYTEIDMEKKYHPAMYNKVGPRLESTGWDGRLSAMIKK